MDSQRVREKFDKLPTKRKQVLLKVLANENKQKIALELCDGNDQAVQQHLRQLYKDFYIQGDRECKLPALIQLFVRCMPELINNRVSRVINDLPDDRGTAKPTPELEEIVGTSASESSPEQVVLDESQPNHSLSDQEKNTPDASHLIRANSFLEYFSKAIDQLESKQIHVRIGAIYYLGKLAKSSQPEDYWTVMEYLATFIRTNAPRKEEEKGKEERSLKISDDIQAALTVIGRRDTEKDPENQRLNLSHTDIRGANLQKANLQRVILNRANLQAAILSGASLQRVDLSIANLGGADLKEAQLEKANLHHADLREAELCHAHLQSANLKYTDLTGANLAGANLQLAKLEEANLHMAYLGLAKLQGAKLQGVKNLELKQIEKAERQTEIL
jgi:hypothetical protein